MNNREQGIGNREKKVFALVSGGDACSNTYAGLRELSPPMPLLEFSFFVGNFLVVITKVSPLRG
jgi:hypothetical protein